MRRQRVAAVPYPMISHGPLAIHKYALRYDCHGAKRVGERERSLSLPLSACATSNFPAGEQERTVKKVISEPCGRNRLSRANHGLHMCRMSHAGMPDEGKLGVMYNVDPFPVLL